MLFRSTVSRPVAAVATIPNGLQNISVLMGEADPGQQLQIFTRDGRQLAGTSVDAATQSLIMTEANGFAANATYSSAYLNVNGSNSYKDISVFYGAKATVGSVLKADATETDPTKHTTLAKVAVPATLQSDRIQTGLTSISSGLFKLNGVALPEISVLTGTLQASDIATKIQAAGISGITASANALTWGIAGTARITDGFGNTAGLQTPAIAVDSNGFKVDTTPPLVAITADKSALNAETGSTTSTVRVVAMTLRRM